MSVTAQSPTLGYKRLLSDSDSPDTSSHLAKRSRHTRKPRSPRCIKRSRQLDDRDILLATLKSLFPQMDETTVVTVLDKCGNDMDEAIRQLGLLHLSHAGQQEAQARHEPAVQSAEASTAPEQAQDLSRNDTPAQQSAAEEPETLKTPAQWIDGLVQEMASAKDLSDARRRAATELRAFEQAVMKSTNKARQTDMTSAQQRVAELSKENAVLKRAINIQQTRLQEAANVNKQQAEQAEAAVTALQAKVHGLEMANYSLSMHLRQATDSQYLSHQRPDVF